MKPFQLLALFLAMGCAQAPAQNNGQTNQAGPPSAGPAATANSAAASPEAEQQAIMDRIERDLRLPEGAQPLAAYGRYYAWQDRSDGVRKVVATFVAGENPGRHWVAETALPLVMDGGCGILSLSYDVAAQRIEHIECNGEA